MQELIPFFIFLGVFIIFLIIANKILPDPASEEIKKPPEDRNNIKINGVNIHLSDEEKQEIERQKEEQERQQFVSAKDYLISVIYEDFEKTEDIIRKKVIEKLFDIKIETIDDLAKLDLLYNDGKLRSNEEADCIERFFRYQKEREQYDEKRHKVNAYSFLIPFISVFVITCLLVRDIFAGPLLGLTFGLIASLIGMFIGHDSNIKDAEEYGIPKDDPRVIDEILKRRASIAALVGTAVIAGHHSKKAVKDFVNVDGWEEMK